MNKAESEKKLEEYWNQAASLHHEDGNEDEVKRLSYQCLKLAPTVYRDKPPLKQAFFCQCLANFFHYAGERDQALKAATTSVNLYKTHINDSPDIESDIGWIMCAYEILAKSQRAMGLHWEAIASFEIALHLARVDPVSGSCTHRYAEGFIKDITELLEIVYDL